MIPASHTAIRDPALRGVPRDVYVWLMDRLDVFEFRPIKHEAIALDLRVKNPTIFKAITLLRTRGYIDRGARDGRLWTYRLAHSRPLPVPLGN